MTAERSGAAWAGAASELLTDRDAGASPRDESRDLIRVYLQPGQLYASGQPSAVTTVLGSCVAICLWDPVVSVGGMNHYLLPFFAGGAGKGSPRFGNVASAVRGGTHSFATPVGLPAKPLRLALRHLLRLDDARLLFD